MQTGADGVGEVTPFLASHSCRANIACDVGRERLPGQDLAQQEPVSQYPRDLHRLREVGSSPIAVIGGDAPTRDQRADQQSWVPDFACDRQRLLDLTGI